MGYKNFITTKYGGTCLQSQHTEGRGRQITVMSRPSSAAQSSRFSFFVHLSCQSIHLASLCHVFVCWFALGFFCFILVLDFRDSVIPGWPRIIDGPASISQGLELLGRATMPTSILCCLKASRKLIILTILQHFRSLGALVWGCEGSYSILQKLNERHPCHIKVGKVKTVSWGQVTT